MKSSDVLQPLILKEAYSKDIAKAAHAEVFRVCHTMDGAINAAGPQSLSANMMTVWAMQRGVNLANLGRQYVENVHKIIAIMGEIIGYKCDISECSVRAQVPNTEWPKLPWHQDGAGMRPAEDSIVSWIPLTPIDGNCPTIEFARNSFTSLLEHERNTNRFLEVENAAPVESTIVEGLEPGAAVIFSPWTLHRTYRTKAMKETRLSLDLRFYQ